MNFGFIQLIGGIGYALITGSYYYKEKKKILYMQILAYIMFTIHYYLLSGITGAICNIIGLFALMSIYLAEENKKINKKIIAFLSIGLLIIINIVTFQNIFSIFPMIASTISIISFLIDSENFIRVVGIFSAICWLIYAIVYKSYISIIFEVFLIIGAIIALIKYLPKRK